MIIHAIIYFNIININNDVPFYLWHAILMYIHAINPKKRCHFNFDRMSKKQRNIIYLWQLILKSWHAKIIRFCAILYFIIMIKNN